MLKSLTNTQQGLVLALTGYSAFAVSDSCVKWLTDYYSIYQIIAIDTLLAGLMLLAFSKRLGGLESLKDKANAKLHILRIVLNFAVNILMVYCLSFLPLVTIYTAVFTKPFLAVLIAMPLYGEKVGLHRWVSIALGFAGIVLAFQPWQNGFGLDFFLPFGLTFLIALLFVLSRSLKDTSILATGFYPIFGAFVLTLPLAVADFAPVLSWHWAVLGLSAMGVAAGITCVSMAFRKADAGLVSPMMYSEMIWALVLGYFIFSETPDIWMLAGAAIIIGGGIYLIESERRKV